MAEVKDEKPPEAEQTNGQPEGKVVEDKPVVVSNGGEEKESVTKEETKEEEDKEKEEEVKEEEKSTEGEKEEEDESSEEEEELPPGLYEKPLIVETKRERKSVSRMSEMERMNNSTKDVVDYSLGTGTRLGDIPWTTHMVGSADTEDLSVLHRIMYGSKGKHTMTKRDIRNFCGFPFDKESKHFRRVKDITDRLFLSALKWTLNLLGLECKKDDETEVLRERLIDYLFKPHNIEKEIPAPKPKTPKPKPKKKKKSTPKPTKKKKSDSNDGDVSEPSSDSDSDNEDGDDDEKQKKKAAAKKKTPKKSPKKNEKKTTQVKIAIPMKKPKSATKKRKPSDESSEDDDEPLAKKTKVPPTNAELKKVVSAILKDADLEQVTMKTVVRDVYEKYSSFDLTSRKDFIKETVKELISG